jgi:hypothetical protein
LTRPSVEATLKHLTARVRDGWAGLDIFDFAEGVSQGQEPKEMYLTVRGSRQVDDMRILREFYESRKIKGPVERIRFLRTRHPTLDRFREELGDVDAAFNAHKQLADQVREAFGDIVYGSAEIIEEESRVFVARMHLEFPDQSLTRGVVKLLENPHTFRTEVNEYWYRARLGLDKPGNFSAAPITVGSKKKYYSIVMGHLGQLNLANWLNILRLADTPELPEQQREILREDRANLMSTANRMIAKSHAHARKMSTPREDYLARAQGFLEHTATFLRMARTNGLLDVTAPKLRSDMRRVSKYVCPNITQLAAYIVQIPPVFYFDCVTKNFPLDPAKADGERTVRLPAIDSRLLETRVLLYTKYLGEEADPSQSKTMPVLPYTVNSVDRCKVKREPGLFDLANFFLTSFFIRAQTPESEEEMVKEVRGLLWEYLVAFDQELTNYNALVQQARQHPRQLIVEQIKLDLETKFMYFLDRTVPRQVLAGAVREVLHDLLKETEAGQTGDIYFGKVGEYVKKRNLPPNTEAYFRTIAKFVRGLKPKKNPYLANKGYTTHVPPGMVLQPNRLENDMPVWNRFRQIETDLYVCLPYRAAMIADTVPFYVSQDGDLTPERINYYQIEVGNMLQSMRTLMIFAQNAQSSQKVPSLREPLDPEGLAQIVAGFEILYKHVSNLSRGRIRDYERLEELYK